MTINATLVAKIITIDTGLGFLGREGTGNDGRWIELEPIGHQRVNTFTIKTTIGWRHIEVIFNPGTFASDLIKSMGEANKDAQELFSHILKLSLDEGAVIDIILNKKHYNLGDAALWDDDWKNFQITIRIGQLELNVGNESEEEKQVIFWTRRMVAAILSLMPLEFEFEKEDTDEINGLPEGASVTIKVNKYERDPRNRAAALSFYGYSCKACNMEMSNIYGKDAIGLIEIHHVTPISKLGSDYKIDPVNDLVPLCPNCHTMVHRRNPPFSIDEVREMYLSHKTDKKSNDIDD